MNQKPTPVNKKIERKTMLCIKSKNRSFPALVLKQSALDNYGAKIMSLIYMKMN